MNGQSHIVTRDVLQQLKADGVARSDAARLLHVSYSTILRAQRKYRIDLDRNKAPGRPKPYTVQQVRDCAASGLSMKQTAAAVGATYVAIRQCAIIYGIRFSTWHVVTSVEDI